MLHYIPQRPKTWSDVIRIMCAKYTSVVGEEVARLRPLDASDFFFFGSSVKWGPEASQPTHRNGSHGILLCAAIANLNVFFSWFDGIMQCIFSIKNLWTRRSPDLSFVLHGFISRDCAAAMLSNSAGSCVGCFVVGLSQSDLCFVLNVMVRDKKIKPVKVFVDNNNALPFSVSFESTKRNFKTLEELIMKSPELMVSFPNLNKNEIYSV